VALFDYGEIDCQLNKDLADYFKVFYTGQLHITLSKQGVPSFAHCFIDLRQSLRQRRQISIVAYEAAIFDTVAGKKIGHVNVVTRHWGRFVNPQILTSLNTGDSRAGRQVKKVRVKDNQWVKITDDRPVRQGSDDDIIEETK